MVRTLPNEGILCGAIISIITAVVGPQIWVSPRPVHSRSLQVRIRMASTVRECAHSQRYRHRCSSSDCTQAAGASSLAASLRGYAEGCAACGWPLLQLTELFTVSGVTILAQDVLLFLFSLSFVFSVGTNLSRVYHELQKRRPIEFRASDCCRMANACWLYRRSLAQRRRR